MPTTDLGGRAASYMRYAADSSELPFYRVRASLRQCQFGSRTVCLDLVESRYFLLEGALAHDLHAFDHGAADSNSIARLMERGLIEMGNPESVLTSLPPETSLLDYRLPRPSPWLLYRSIAEQRIARRSLGRYSLAELLKPTGLDSTDAEGCRPVAAAFARASRYRSATDQCLVRALAMRRILAHRGLGVDLVIGVMLPFAAHCWLQAGSVILSDPFDRVCNFKPLLTVR